MHSACCCCDKSWGISHVCVRLSHSAATDHYGGGTGAFFTRLDKNSPTSHTAKKIQGWENRGSSVWPINAIVAKTIDGFFNRCPLMRSNAQTLRRSTVKNILMPRDFLGTGQPTFMKGMFFCYAPDIKYAIFWQEIPKFEIFCYSSLWRFFV